MLLLQNKIQGYLWGSRTKLAEFLGQPSPAAVPQAEMWMGAHPAAPSCVQRDGIWQPLTSWIEEDPRTVLGERVHRAYGPRLPFLLKVLAVESPLSLQAHPSTTQAAAGFDAEEAAGIPLDARDRSYKDRSHKPELLCALTPFDALCGFRRVDDSLRLFGSLRVPALAPFTDIIARDTGPTTLKAAFSSLMAADRDFQRAVADGVAEACEKSCGPGQEFEAELAWARRISALYPGDIGIVGALLLNLVHLRPGQAFYLPTGCLHAYLQGTGVEIMASSDNVLRGGLTPKYVGVAELLRVLDFQTGPVPVLETISAGPARQVFVTPAPEFELSTIELDGSRLALTERLGPEILLCESGNLVATSAHGSVPLVQGTSVLVIGSEGRYELEGRGRLFRAAVQSA